MKISKKIIAIAILIIVVGIVGLFLNSKYAEYQSFKESIQLDVSGEAAIGWGIENGLDRVVFLAERGTMVTGSSLADMLRPSVSYQNGVPIYDFYSLLATPNPIQYSVRLECPDFTKTEGDCIFYNDSLVEAKIKCSEAGSNTIFVNKRDCTVSLSKSDNAPVTQIESGAFFNSAYYSNKPVLKRLLIGTIDDYDDKATALGSVSFFDFLFMPSEKQSEFWYPAYFDFSFANVLESNKDIHAVEAGQHLFFADGSDSVEAYLSNCLGNISNRKFLPENNAIVFRVSSDDPQNKLVEFVKQKADLMDKAESKIEKLYYCKFLENFYSQNSILCGQESGSPTLHAANMLNWLKDKGDISVAANVNVCDSKQAVLDFAELERLTGLSSLEEKTEIGEFYGLNINQEAGRIILDNSGDPYSSSRSAQIVVSKVEGAYLIKIKSA